MALPTIAVVQAAVTSLYSALADRPTRQRGRQGVQSLNEMLGSLIEAYATDVTVAITDSTDAGVSEAIAADGEIGVALGRVGAVGDIFTTSGGTNDFTDNALATAKGSAVASNDRFQVTGADAVAYLGGATDVEMDDEQLNDFAGKAGN